jgi:hypothetical protein
MLGQGLTPVISVPWKAEIRRIVLEASLDK